MAEGERPLTLVAGPCVLEEGETALAVAEVVASLEDLEGVRPFFKASYDKANRTRSRSYRGPGLRAGRAILERVRGETGVSLLVDVHTPEEAHEGARFAQVLQVPAFLCRQTDLVRAAASRGGVVNLKKGQFLSPVDMEAVVEKAWLAGAREIWVTERGHSFGYGDWVMDMRSVVALGDLGVTVLADPCHGSRGLGPHGPRDFIMPLACAAVAAGAGGIYLEVHPEPSRSPSDGPSSLPLEGLRPLVERISRLKKTMEEGDGGTEDRD